MKKLLPKLNTLRFSKNTIWFLVMTFTGLLLFYLLAFVLSPFDSMSRFPTAFLLIYIGILALMYMDRIHHSDINTTKAISENNISYGLIMLAYAVIIAAVISSV